jgi:saccharopine dehydrogenase-like NADP-dependent oxidoreductase
MRILILGGAGMMGSGTARDLVSAQSTGVERVLVADTSLERARAACRAAGGDPRLEPVALDVTDAAGLGRLIAAADLCINAVPTFAGHQMAIFEACLAARRPYIDYGGLGIFTVRQKAEHQRWMAAGVPAVLGLGADPGISNLACKTVAERLDTIDRINLYWAATTIGSEVPVLVPPYSIATVLAEFAHPSKQFLDGKLVEVPPQSGREVLDLPEPFGRTEFIHTLHSEPLTVPFAKGIADKGIREFTWKLSLPRAEHEIWASLVKAGFGDFDDPVTVPGGTVKPIDVLNAVVFRNIERNRARIPSQHTYQMHFAIGRGSKAGKPMIVRCAVTDAPDPIYDGYVDAATSMGASIGAQLMLRQPIVPGVWGPEEYFDTAVFFAELEKRHFKVEIRAEAA